MTILALFGAGEFSPWAREADLWCAERSTASGDRVLVVPTACAEEGPDSWNKWASMGIDHYRAIGLSPEVLELRTRHDAGEPSIVDAVAGARLIFFSGGNPGYLAETLDSTPFWDAVLSAMREGTALGGCSAGAAFLGVRAPFVKDDSLHRWVDGAKLLEKSFIVPHFDALESYQPGLRAQFLNAAPPGTRTVGLDENTALCGDGERWAVIGRGAAWISAQGNSDDLHPYRTGDDVQESLGLSL
jgi:cyanophycinase